MRWAYEWVARCTWGVFQRSDHYRAQMAGMFDNGRESMAGRVGVAYDQGASDTLRAMAPDVWLRNKAVTL